MKIFSRDKYEYIGIRAMNEAQDDLYFAFRCIKRNFSPEIVLVKEAKLIYSDWGYVYFNQKHIDTSSLSVKDGCECQKSLIYNERKWRHREDRSKVMLVPERHHLDNHSCC